MSKRGNISKIQLGIIKELYHGLQMLGYNLSCWRRSYWFGEAALAAANAAAWAAM
jgi:hypothetical protein